jgi:hypothetical protein
MSKAPIDMLMLQGISRGRLGIYWLQTLAGAGVRREDSELSERAYSLARELDLTDEEISQTRVADILFFPLPKGWWFWLPCIYAAAFIWSAQGDSFEERVFTWGSFLVIFGVFAIMVIGYKLISEYRLKQEKEKLRPILKKRRKELEEDLVAVRDELVAAVSKIMDPP